LFTVEQIETIVDFELHALLWSSPKPDPEGGDANGYFLDDYESENATPELKNRLLDEVEHLDGQDNDRYSLETLAELPGAISAYKAHMDNAHPEDVWLECFGHDIAMTRNGHGVGFWDRGLPGDAGAVLSRWARSLGELHIFDDFVSEKVTEWRGMFHAE